MSKSVWISLALALMATLWVLSGTLFGANGPEDDEVASAKSTLFKVKALAAKAEQMTHEVILQGEISAGKSIDIRAETSGVVGSLSAEQGDFLKEGQEIARIKIDDRAAKLAEAQAQLRVAKADLEANKALRKKKLISANQFERNLASVSAAEASVTQMESELANTKIVGAFDGRLNTLDIEVGDFVNRGDRIGTLIDPKTVKITATIPQHNIFKAKLGQRVQARLLDGTLIEGKITYISASAEPITRAFKMEAIAKLEQATPHVGLSARITLNVETRLAHKFPVSYLDLDAAQKLRIKAVDEKGIVISYPVSIIQHATDGVWLDGLPNAFNVITQGQGFVDEGDEVEPVFPSTDSRERETSTDASTTIETSEQEAS